MAAGAPFLATLPKRLIAALIDLAPILLFIIIGISIFLDANYSPSSAISICVLVYVGYHGAFLAMWHGESPGRRSMDIGVASAGGKTGLSSMQCFGRPLAQISFLFAGAALARYFHSAVLLSVPLLIDSFLLLFLPTRQSVADMLCRTIVISLPPLQPHRAPAAPMFSAVDAEFGFGPKRGK